MQNYIKGNVESTAKKIKKAHKIYPMVFFVVPTEAVAGLKKKYYFEGGYQFFIISPEAIPAILSSLKRISEYELAQEIITYFNKGKLGPEFEGIIINLANNQMIKITSNTFKKWKAEEMEKRKLLKK